MDKILGRALDRLSRAMRNQPVADLPQILTPNKRGETNISKATTKDVDPKSFDNEVRTRIQIDTVYQLYATFRSLCEAYREIGDPLTVQDIDKIADTTKSERFIEKVTQAISLAYAQRYIKNNDRNTEEDSKHSNFPRFTVAEVTDKRKLVGEKILQLLHKLQLTPDQLVLNPNFIAILADSIVQDEYSLTPLTDEQIFIPDARLGEVPVNEIIKAVTAICSDQRPSDFPLKKNMNWSATLEQLNAV